MTNEEVVDLARHIPVDGSAKKVVGVTSEDWFVVGPNCLELWWQFNGSRYYKFIDPYVKKILGEIENRR